MRQPQGTSIAVSGEVTHLHPARTRDIPRATYRLQLHAGFTLKAATEIVPYLAKLGISHVYCSPYFRARPGSLHGYDVVDHNALNPEIGSREDLEAFVATLRAHEMGHILDFVPNHVGVMGADNERWMDVLEHGQASRFAEFFDIAWYPPNQALHGKLLVPALGDSYGTVLESGELQLRYEAERGAFAIFYHQHRFPIDPKSYRSILHPVVDALESQGKAQLVGELRRIASAFDSVSEHPEVGRCKEELRAFVGSNVEIDSVLQRAIDRINGTGPDAAGFDSLHALLEEQHYRLAFWRVASDDINYRRFFDVNDLAALRMENDAVFESTHRLLLELIQQGKLDGVRIDHPDGLFDPAAYFARLQASAGATEGERRPLYLLIEKITAAFERLPVSWPVHGTTGYNFAVLANGLFVDGRARASMDRLYRSFIGDYREWPECAFESKILVMRTSLSAELNVLANHLVRIAQCDRHTRDFTLAALRHALVEVIACFPVYRTYVTDSASENDRRYIDWAIGKARRRSDSTAAPVLEFVRAMMLADSSAAPEAIRSDIEMFARKVQQVTAPVTAKGVEDTALYRFTRLTSLNEVGGDPDVFGTTVSQFHADAEYRQKNWPHEMLATSTHDTKRSEDVRARINVLSEMPSVWGKLIRRWSRINRNRRRMVDGAAAPGVHAEYLLYQTLIGTWPARPLEGDAHAEYCKRIGDYMIKASREAKRRTSWSNPDEQYETALREFISAVLERRESNLFPVEVDAFARRIARFGYFNSLSQLLCKLTAPGVPDIYQGSELWDDSLVDPDNRRVVDYARRRELLDSMTQPDLGDGLPDGSAKMYVTSKVLSFRRSHADIFREGTYRELKVSGAKAAHLCAYARTHASGAAIVLVPRLFARLLGENAPLPIGEAVWGDTIVELPEDLRNVSFESVLGRTDGPAATTDGSLRVGAALHDFPVGLFAVGTAVRDLL